LLPSGSIRKERSPESAEARWKVQQSGVVGGTFVSGELEALLSRKLKMAKDNVGSFYIERKDKAAAAFNAANLVTYHA